MGKKAEKRKANMEKRERFFAAEKALALKKLEEARIERAFQKSVDQNHKEYFPMETRQWVENYYRKRQREMAS